MKKYLYSLRSDLLFSSPVKSHSFVLRTMPMVEAGQEPMRTSVTCNPACELAPYRDAFGNTVHQGYIEDPHESFVFCSTGEVLIDKTKVLIDEPAPYYYLPSGLTKLSGGLEEFANEVKSFDSPRKTAEELLTQIAANLRYEKGQTTTATTASEAWTLGCGVCQDFTHIMIAVLRSKGIACRYVAGLVVGQGASHAWLEFFDGKCWVGIDPTHSCLCDEKYMKISHGPDFSECSLERGVFLGDGKQTMNSMCALIEIQ